jgi:hypothetical protein
VQVFRQIFGFDEGSDGGGRVVAHDRDRASGAAQHVKHSSETERWFCGLDGRYFQFGQTVFCDCAELWGDRSDVIEQRERIYAKCLDGTDAAVRRRVEESLGH